MGGNVQKNPILSEGARPVLSEVEGKAAARQNSTPRSGEPLR